MGSLPPSETSVVGAKVYVKGRAGMVDLTGVGRGRRAAGSG